MFLEILQNSQACNFIKKETLAQVFSYEFCEISNNIFFTEHLWETTAKTGKTFSNFWHLGQNDLDFKKASKEILNYFEFTFFILIYHIWQ